MYLTLPRRLAAIRRVLKDRSGVAALEFALTAPIVFGIGMWGIETANLAVMNLRVSQIALNLADNASRVGVSSNLAMQQLREVDINDVLAGARYQGQSIRLVENGRITLSSLETNEDGGQWIHWQRCLGMKTGTNYDSSYGRTNDGENGTGFQGMGPAGAKVTAPPGSGVMFVEINYDYRPLFSSTLVGTKQIRYIASFIVRDRRDFEGPGGAGIYNPAPTATASTCTAARA